jgi:hypothetical protein
MGLQNSPAAQTLVIADLTLRRDLFAKTLSMAAHSDIVRQIDIKPCSKFICHCGGRDCVVITFLAFRASEARPGIQYIQQLLDAGFHRHDDFNNTFCYRVTVSEFGSFLVIARQDRAIQFR